MAIDERGLMDKVQAGDLGALDAGDIANVGQMATGAMAGKIPFVGGALSTIPGGTALSAGVSGVASFINSDKEAAILAQNFSKGNLKALKRQNPAFRRKLRDMEDRWQGDMVDATLSAGAGAGVGALIGMLLGPLGALAGSAVGGFIGHKIYSSTLEDQAQDPVAINLQAVKMQQEGQGVPTEVVFATLAANLSGDQGKRAGKLLKQYTGTELFSEALANPKNIKKLQAMMHDPVIDKAIRAQTGMMFDVNDPLKSVAEQYAELINGGHMQAKNMLNTGEGLYVLTAMQQGVAYNVDVPETPHGRHRGMGRTA